MLIRKFNDKKIKLLIFQGSPRDNDTCPGMLSKTEKIVQYIETQWGIYFDIEILNLKVNQSKAPTIQPCKACISSAGGYHCHFPCSCYKKGSNNTPDFMSENDVYDKLKNCDVFLIASPIHWFALTSQVKLLFDRLVCANMTLTIDDAKRLMGNDIKNIEVTGPLNKEGTYNNLLKNHLEGKLCSFYVHGDDGANDYEGQEYPESFKGEVDVYSSNPRMVLTPFITQMRYSGVFVPEDFVEVFYVNKGVDYYSSNEYFDKTQEFFDRADRLLESILNFFDNQ